MHGSISREDVDRELRRRYPNVSPDQAESEQEYRRLRRNSLIAYARSIEIPGVPLDPENPDCEEFRPIESGFAKHHILWLGVLQKVEDGEIKRAMGLMPPGSAKSTYTSVVFPTHVMGRFPGSNVIVTNYGSDLPRKWGRRGRSIARQKQFRRIFGADLSADSKAADEWELDNGSTFMGAGLLSGVTGNRADLVIWDDPIRGREQADSEIIRNKIWDAYFDDVLPRKKPAAREVGITTRWSEDDLAGRILPENYNGESGWIKGRDGNDWFVVCLPAIAEREDDLLGRAIGERIWPEWFGEDHFKPFMLNARTWNALYQQRPAPASGMFFKREWLKPYTKDMLPDRGTLAVYGGSDYATTEGGGDYTVHGLIGIDPQDRPWLLPDLYRAQESSDKWIEAWCDLVLKWKPIGWGEERGQIIAGVGPFLEREARKRKAWCAREQFTSREGKEIRAQSIRGYIAMQGLYVPVDAPWYPQFESELLAFPAGRHDDQVDMLSKIGDLLDKIATGRKLKIPEPIKVDGYRTSQDDLVGGERDSFLAL